MDDSGALTLVMNFIAPVILGAALFGASFYTWRRHRRGDGISVAGAAGAIVAAIALSLLIFVWASTPRGLPNSGSTSTSGEVDPASTVAPEGPKPGINPDGR
jgi:hypothetical protein